ncbi:MAG: aromatic ring-hydroxylating dioxygenase subunit alpha [Gammaproteobacteria bacterium]
MNAPDTNSISTNDNRQSALTALPAHWYFDPAQYERELQRIWYRNWLYFCRADTLVEPRSFRTVSIGTQNILLVRDEEGGIRAFHNTCRHRGAALCVDSSGQLPTRRIVCPYHRWSYSLRGDLVGVPFLGTADKVSNEDLSLYSVAVKEWRGSVFINLADNPARDFDAIMDPHADELRNWPLEALKVGHRHQAVLRCNWKIFWENFLECYHCPGIHPELCQMVPIYRRGVSTATEAHSVPEYCGSHDPQATDGLRELAQTWSMDGKIHGARFNSLTAEEAAVGYRFLMAWPTMYMVAHPDYVRIVSFRPLGPESVELAAEWLFPQETLTDSGFDLRNVTDFATLVMTQDGMVSELNQAGLRSIKHEHGVLVPQEMDINRFHAWVRSQLDEA